MRPGNDDESCCDVEDASSGRIVTRSSNAGWEHFSGTHVGQHGMVDQFVPRSQLVGKVKNSMAADREPPGPMMPRRTMTVFHEECCCIGPVRSAWRGNHVRWYQSGRLDGGWDEGFSDERKLAIAENIMAFSFAPHTAFSCADCRAEDPIERVTGEGVPQSSRLRRKGVGDCRT